MNFEFWYLESLPCLFIPTYCYRQAWRCHKCHDQTELACNCLPVIVLLCPRGIGPKLANNTEPRRAIVNYFHSTVRSIWCTLHARTTDAYPNRSDLQSSKLQPISVNVFDESSVQRHVQVALAAEFRDGSCALGALAWAQKLQNTLTKVFNSKNKL